MKPTGKQRDGSGQAEMNPTDEQRVAIETLDRSLIVEAGAGTGKTWVLVQRFMFLLEAHPDWPLESIVAITFTEKAAREMRTRLRQAVERKARQAPQDARWRSHRLNLDQLQVSTIHSLCARILRENAISAEIDPHFQVLDEQEADLLKEAAIKATIQTLDQEDHPALELLSSLRVYDLRAEMERLLSKRGTLQRIFSQLDPPELLLERWKAGLELVRQEIWKKQLKENPELATVVRTIPSIKIFDPSDRLAGSVGYAQQGCKNYSKGNFLAAADVWLSIQLVGGKKDNWGGKEALTDLKADLKILRTAAKELEKAGMLQEIGAADRTAAQHLHLWQKLWLRLEETYTQIKDERGSLDFDDLELLTGRLLHKSPPAPRLQAFLEGINHLMVDEFQDTNLVQQRIVYALAPPDDRGKLFVVGDAKQSIYRFRQAQVSIFNQTAGDMRKTSGHAPIRLSTSFRTHQSLVRGLNDLFDHILLPQGEDYAPFEAPPGPLRAHRYTHPHLLSPVEMLLLPAKDENDRTISAEDARIWEARWLAKRILELQACGFSVWDKHLRDYRPFQFGDAGLLFRATTSLPLYEAEFKAFGLPYLTVSGRGYFDRPEVLDLIALLSALANPADDVNLASALRSPLFSLNDESLYWLRWYSPDGSRIKEPNPYALALSQPAPTEQSEIIAKAFNMLTRLWALVGRVDIWTLLRTALDETGYEAILALNDGETGRQRTNVHKLLALARDVGGSSLPRFLGRIGDLRAREAREGEALGREPESGAVQLMSIHAAKGLEFPVVAVADMGRRKRAGFGTAYMLHDPAFGLLCKVRDENGDWFKPAGYAWGEWINERMEEAERKRLLYVACTRAADLLILSGKLGGKDTWLQEVLDAWGIEPYGPREETLPFDGFTVRIHRPVERELSPERGYVPPRTAPRLDVLPPLSLPLPSQTRTQHAAVTRLERLLAQDDADLPEVRPALWLSQDTKTAKYVPAHRIGNIVHHALAHWDCITYAHDSLSALLRNFARRQGVFPGGLRRAVGTSASILMKFRRHRLYQEIESAKQRHHEVPFSLHSPLGTLHGVIDLLYQDQRGNWHLLDWKTAWTQAGERGDIVRQHLTQLAAYAQAAQKTLGVMPGVALCFLHPKVVVYPFSVQAIEKAWAELVVSLPSG